MYGLLSIAPVQKDSINEALRNGCWTIVSELLNKNTRHDPYDVPQWRQKSAKFIWKIWVDFFKLKFITIGNGFIRCLAINRPQHLKPKKWLSNVSDFDG